MMRYVSTRGPGQPKDFADVLLSGLAPDGGLYMPMEWPSVDTTGFSGLSYAETALRVMKPFIGDTPGAPALEKIVRDTYEGGAFDHPSVAPLVQAGTDLWLLELFHGPTLSFKDYALQLLGRLFDHVLAEKGERITIVGATSGDTGSAAIEACRGRDNIDIFILHPYGRTSDVQRKQMTTVGAPNVHNIAIDGTFDDCQTLVKAMFADEMLRRDLNLSAVNSINWARIMAQTVYYFAASAQFPRGAAFTVPTGNFGNVFATWSARRMGAPVRNLVIASNRNDILTRFFETGAMTFKTVEPSLSPSMDIQISSNFERYLFELCGHDHYALRGMMETFARDRSFSLPPDMMKKARADFKARRCTDAQTLETMKNFYSETGMQIDPHTAVGVHAARLEAGKNHTMPMVIASTAHPAKFPEAVEKATGRIPPVPERLAAVLEKKESFSRMPNDIHRIKDFVRQNSPRR